MPIFLVSEQDILDSAGLDALVFLRIIRMGIHFFLPVTLLAFVTLVPLHSTAGSWVNQTDVEFVSKAGGLRLFNSTTPFTSISMVQVPKGSNVLWVHVVFLHIVIAWACFLCYRNYLTFVVLRHNYVGRVLLPDEMESGQLKLRSCAECMHGWQSGFCGELISGSRDADLSTPEEHMELRPNPGDEDTAFRNPAQHLGVAAAATVLARRLSSIRMAKAKSAALQDMSSLEDMIRHASDDPVHGSGAMAGNGPPDTDDPRAISTPPLRINGFSRGSSNRTTELAERFSVHIEGGAVVGPYGVAESVGLAEAPRVPKLSRKSADGALQRRDRDAGAQNGGEPAGGMLEASSAVFRNRSNSFNSAVVAGPFCLRAAQSNGSNPDGESPELRLSRVAGKLATEALQQGQGSGQIPDRAVPQPELERAEKAPSAERNSLKRTVSQKAASKWWEELSSVANLRPVGGSWSTSSEEQANQPGAADGCEDRSAASQGEPSDEESAVTGAVHVLSKPQVLNLKTVATTTPSGRPCRVLSELYAVLVTGVPKLEKRKEIFRRQQRDVVRHSSPSLISKMTGGLLHIGGRDKVGSNRRDNEAGPSKAAELEIPRLVNGTASSQGRVQWSPETRGEGAEHLVENPLANGRFSTESQEDTDRVRRQDTGESSGVARDSSSLSLHEMVLHDREEFAAMAKRKNKYPQCLAEQLDCCDSEDESERPTQPKGAHRRTNTQSSLAKPREYDIVAAVFKRMFPNTFFCTIPIHKDSKVQRLLFKWNAMSRQLEITQRKTEVDGRRPRIRVGGIMGVGGIETDAESYYKSKVSEIEEEIIRARSEAWNREASPSSFVLFYDQFSATVAAQSVIHPEDGHVFNTQPAPGPDDINWPALWRSSTNQCTRRVLAVPFLVFVVLFPAGLFSAAISQFNAAICAPGMEAAPLYCGTSGSNFASRLHGLVQSPLIPSFMLSLWQVIVMPYSLYYLSLFQSDKVSRSALDRKIAVYFFQWGLFNVFLGGMLGGMSELLALVAEPTSVLSTVGNSLVKASNFFIQFVQFQTLVIAVYDIFQPHGGIWFYLAGRIFHYLQLECCFLERDVAMTWTAKSLRYGREIPIHLLIFLLGLAYSTASPGILPYCSGYFVIYWMVRRYHILYVFERCYESGGLFWPLVFDLFMIMLFTYQVFMSAVLITFGAPLRAGVCFLTVPAGLYYFRRYCHKRFNNAAIYLPLEMADRAPPAVVDPAMYVPAPLRNGAHGWHPEERKAWSGYGMWSSTI